jgi:hypothetical protein
MHTDYTLKFLEGLTKLLGDKLRFFANDVCSKFETFELPREAKKRQRRKAKKSHIDDSDADATKGSTQQRKMFNMDTYKHHALGDYVETIRMYGTCDSYSTEMVRSLCEGVCSVPNLL